MIIELKPKIGINELSFGTKMKDVELYLGKPEEVERIDEIEEYKSTVWHYWDHGFSLFFDESSEGKFSCIEIDNEETHVWGEKIFNMTEKDIIELFKKKGFKDLDTEQQKWGEKRVSFDDAVIDFYFENNKLTSVNCSMPISQNRILIFPN